MNRQKWTILAAFGGLLGMAVIIGCGVASDGFLFPGAGLTIPTTPAFLVAIDATGAASANINVFPINTTTGALGTAVTGSPFNLGLTDPMTVQVHPNGHWIYVADGSDGTIHAYDVNTTTGVPTAIGNPVANESGFFYEPSGSADSPTKVLAITPDGSFLFASDDNSNVSVYSIGANGGLTHVTDFAIPGATRTGALTTNGTFVWVNDTPESSDGACDTNAWAVHALKIGSGGSLTKVSSTNLSNVFCWLWSIAVSPDSKAVQVGDEGGNAQVYSFTVGADGSLAQVGPQVVLNSSSDARYISYSPDGKFFYISDDDDVVHGCKQNADGSFTELANSPYVTAGSSGDQQIEADRSGKFVYSGGESNSISSYTRDATTGELTFIGETDTFNTQTIAIGVVYK